MPVKKYKFFTYKHPINGNLYRDLREFKDKDIPYKDEDGVECNRVPDRGENPNRAPRGWRKDRETFEADPDYVKRVNPKYIKFNDGHRERYDPTKHC